LDKFTILNTFIQETIDILQNMSDQLMDLEHDMHNGDIVNNIFRYAHTLKGNSYMAHNTIQDFDAKDPSLFHINNLATLTHALENVISEVRDERLELTEEYIDVLFQTHEVLESILSFIQVGSEDTYDISETFNNLKSIIEQTSEIEQKQTMLTNKNNFEFIYQIQLHIEDEEKFPTLSLVYIDTKTMYEHVEFEPSLGELKEGVDFDKAFLKFSHPYDSEEVLAFLEKIKDIKQVSLIYKKEKEEEQTDKTNGKSPKIVKKESNNTTIRVNTERFDVVLKHVSNLVILKNKLINFTSDTAHEEYKSIKETVDEISKAVEYLRESVMDIRMTPLLLIFNRFPRDVRQTAKEYNKKVDFEIDGGETEIDKSLLDQLPEPLMHLIRNSVFHGIESEEERIQAGKNPIGKVSLSAKQEESDVVITIQDDGRGINADKIVKKAISRGLLTEEKAALLSKEEKLGLIFHQGISTAETVTQHAGRGVGMDVVKKKIVHEMKGQIELDSIEGVGTTTTIRLPFTLAILSAMLTKIGNDIFAFPTSQIELVEEILVDDIKYIANQEVYILKDRDREIPIIHLDKFFNLNVEKNNPEKLRIVVLKSANRMIGVTVDEFLRNEDIVLKSVGKYLGNIPGISGCNVLGNGDISLIVDANSLINHITKVS